MERPIPYKGEAGYIFISYAHRDADRVWPIIARMQADGFRVWYDDGIDPGTEWDENIAAHVTDCGYFVAFLSENYLGSNNCKDELNFSRDQGKPQLLIYLEDVTLPSGMAMRLGRNQAIFPNQYEEDVFFRKLYEAQEIQYFRGSNQAPERKHEKKRASKTVAMKKRVSLWPIVAAVLLVAAAAVVLLWPGEEAPPAETQPSAETVTPVTEPEMKEAFNVELADTDSLKITALKTELDSKYYILTLSVTNKTNNQLTLALDHFYLNGVKCQPSGSGSVFAGETLLMQLHWQRSVMESYGIDPEAVTIVEGELGGSFVDKTGQIPDHSITYYPYGEENAVLLTYTPDEDDVILLDTQDYLIAVRDSFLEEGSENWVMDMVFVNRRSENVYLSASEERINNCLGPRSIEGIRVNAGRTAYAQQYLLASQWKPVGYDSVWCYSGLWEIGKEQYPFVYYPMTDIASTPRQLTQEQLLFENENIRAGYLGYMKAGEITVDTVYVCNVGTAEIELEVSLECGGGEGYECFVMAPGEEAIIMCNYYWGGRGETMKARFRWDLPDWTFEQTEITFPVDIG